MKKYELTDETIEYCGRLLYRIRALKDFSYVNKGDLGGYVANYENAKLGVHAEGCSDSKICGNIIVFGDANVYVKEKIYNDSS